MKGYRVQFHGGPGGKTATSELFIGVRIDRNRVYGLPVSGNGREVAWLDLGYSHWTYQRETFEGFYITFGD